MDNGEAIPEFLTDSLIIPGIKVDQGLEPLNDTESYTKGLDGLKTRLREYYQMGLRFAKWRAAFSISLSPDGAILTPSDDAINENCRILAEYALNCQSAGLVPIVEPEVVYDGKYEISDCAATTSKILDQLFATLKDFNVNLKACILKTNMVLAGKQNEVQSTPEEVGIATAKVLKSHVPPELAGLVFLSGGQTPEQATDNLQAIIKNGPFPWPITFSYARAIQDPALYAWKGDSENIDAAKKAFEERLIANTNALKV
jgi:fructose-bisphosphate aldolase class I